MSGEGDRHEISQGGCTSVGCFGQAESHHPKHALVVTPPIPVWKVSLGTVGSQETETAVPLSFCCSGERSPMFVS